MASNIAILTGGNSSEFSISLNSANQVIQHLDRNEFRPYKIILEKGRWEYDPEDGSKPVPVDLNDFSLTLSGKKITFKAVFIAIHGTPGEDGKLQSYLELVGLPYTGCNPIVSAITFHKFMCKRYLEAFRILTPPAILTHNTIDEQQITDAGLSFPLFVKANRSGSSYGVTRVQDPKGLFEAVTHAFKESPDVLIEEEINGIEVTCGICQAGGEKMIFPPTEIVSHNEYFDFEAKYTPGMSEEITPARLPAEKIELIRDTASMIYDILGCRGIVRVDFILKDDRLFFLEVNSIPGLTRESIIPKQAAAYGITLTELYSRILRDCLAG